MVILQEESTIAERNAILEVYLTIQIYSTLRGRSCVMRAGKFVVSLEPSRSTPVSCTLSTLITSIQTDD